MSEKSLVLLWAQEFNEKGGTLPDTQRVWTYDLGSKYDGWGNQELEYYTDHNAVTDGKGNLVISATRIPSQDPVLQEFPHLEFFSTRMHTKNHYTFKYGRIEARIKMPKGQGTWPAMWLLGSSFGDVEWPHCGEIDVIEIGDEKNKLHCTLHGPGYFGDDGLTGPVILDSNTLSDEFHDYAIEWTPEKIEWYFDGELIASKVAADAQARGSEWVFDDEFFIIINLAMGGMFVPGGIDPDLQSASYTIDYIRHYSVNGVGSVRALT